MGAAVEGLLREAIVSRSPEALDGLVASGKAAVQCLRDVSEGRRRLHLPAGRNSMDGLVDVASFLGRSLPQEYFELFADDAEGYLIRGLAATGLAQAQPVLLRILQHGPQSDRVWAAIGLRDLPGPAAVKALIRATGDEDYYVRYHATVSLAVIGDQSVLPRLRELAAESPNHGVSLPAVDAIKAIESRRAGECDRSRGEGGSADG